MSQFEFIIFCNFLSFFFMFFLMIFAIVGKNFPKELNRFFIISILCTFLLTVFDAVNCYYRRLPTVHQARVVASVLGYMIRPVCAALFLLMSIKNTRKNYIIVFSICLINALIVVFNLKMPVVFYFDEMNQFHRASLWFVPYLSSFGLIITLVVSASMQILLNRRKAIFIYAVFISVSIGAYMEAFDYARFAIPTAGIVCIFFYFLYMNTDLYKRDTLTRLYNRSSFDQDLIKFSRRKMVIAAMDMNDLKYWNDTFGHSEGDCAIVTSVNGMKKCFEKIGLMYRTGGDEFMAIFPKKDIADIQNHIHAFQSYMNTTKYRVALGCAQYHKGDSLEEILKLADERMYKNKKAIKEAEKKG